MNNLTLGPDTSFLSRGDQDLTVNDWSTYSSALRQATKIKARDGRF